MINAPHLAKAFGRNTSIVGMQVAGLTHEESLIQTPYNVNCLNWTLGHILVYRDRILTTAGREPQFPAGELDRYRRESEPILEDGPGVLPLEQLASAIEASRQSTTRWAPCPMRSSPQRRRLTAALLPSPNVSISTTSTTPITPAKPKSCGRQLEPTTPSSEAHLKRRASRGL